MIAAYKLKKETSSNKTSLPKIQESIYDLIFTSSHTVQVF